jgi:hypothetical protein
MLFVQEGDVLLEAAKSDAQVSAAAARAAVVAKQQSYALRGRTAAEQLTPFLLEMDARISKLGGIALPDAEAPYSGLPRAERGNGLANVYRLSQSENDRVPGQSEDTAASRDPRQAPAGAVRVRCFGLPVVAARIARMVSLAEVRLRSLGVHRCLGPRTQSRDWPVRSLYDVRRSAGDLVAIR